MMDHSPGPRAGRAALAAAAAAAAAWTLARLAVHAAAHLPAPDAAVGTLVLGVGATAAGVLAVGCALLTAAGTAGALGRTWVRTEAVAARLVPAMVRRALTVGVGAGMTLGLGTAAVADDADLGWRVTTPAVAAAAEPAAATPPATAPATSDPAGPTAPPTPDETPGPRAAPASTPTPAPAEPPPTVTVRPGDSLWSITAALLPGASDAAVAAAWPRLYDANRDRLGPDPDLIHPGVVLTVPQEVHP